jgi:hypothetical protein
MGYNVWGQYMDYVDYWSSKIMSSPDSNWKEEMALLKLRQEGPGVTREDVSEAGGSQRSAVSEGGVVVDAITLGALPTRVELDPGNAGRSKGVVRGVGVARKLVLMLQMTVTTRAEMAQRQCKRDLKRLEAAVVSHCAQCGD